MSGGRVRLTRGGWVVLATVVLLVVSGLTVVVVRSLAPADCTVRVDGRRVELSRAEAEQAATVTASAVRRGSGLAATTAVVARTLSGSGDKAQVVATALSGRAPAALTCRMGGASTSESDRLDSHGLTGRAAVVRTDVLDHFGPVPLGGFARGGVRTGHMPGSAHYEGRAIDAFFRPVTARTKTRGWALAQYLVARAARLEINTVIFDDRIWTTGRADEGWRDYAIDTSGKSRAVARVLEHRDHVHVDVAD